MNQFRHVSPGDPPVRSAALHNATVDLIVAHQRKMPPQTTSMHGIEALYVHVRNDTESRLSRFDAVGLGGPVCDPSANADGFRNRILMRGVVPESIHAGKFAIVQEDIETGFIGRACMIGATQARIKTDENTVDYCDIESGETKHLKAGGNIDVLWIEDEAGEKDFRWAVIRIGGGGGGTPTIYGTIIESVAPNEDLTADLPALGRVRIDGKQYVPEKDEQGNELPIEYDLCGCWELSFLSNEHLLPGMRVQLSGPFTHSETVTENEEETTRETVYYLAIGTTGEYFGELDGELTPDNTTTISLREKEGDQEEEPGDATITVFGGLIPKGQLMSKDAGVYTRRGFTFPEHAAILQVVAGGCPEYIDEEKEPEEPEETEP